MLDTRDATLTLSAAQDILPELNALLARATDALRAQVSVGGRIDASAMEVEQHAAHALSWIATYVESLTQLSAWADRLGPAMGEMERLILSVGFGEYLTQLAGGIPMSQTEFARLSDLEPWHAEQLAGLFRAHGSDFYDWLPWEGFEDVEGARGFLESFATGRGEGSRRLYGIWVDDELVGGTLFPSINARSRTAEAGVFLAASARGRGIVTRAVAAMLDWAFVDRGLHRVEWRCAPGNHASRRVAERLGFNLRTLHVFVFAYAGLLAGVAGIMHVALNRLANPTDLAGSELDVIAAVVLGGTRITGGAGTVIGTILGVVLITLVKNVLILAGIPTTWQLAIIGAFIVLAGLVFSIRPSRR